MKRKLAGTLAAAVALGAGISPVWANTQGAATGRAITPEAAHAAAPTRLGDVVATPIAVEVQMIHDALTIPELDAVQAAA